MIMTGMLSRWGGGENKEAEEELAKPLPIFQVRPSNFVEVVAIEVGPIYECDERGGYTGIGTVLQI
jgi:hypothetical protein